jgi:hypothetical protein
MSQLKAFLAAHFPGACLTRTRGPSGSGLVQVWCYIPTAVAWDYRVVKSPLCCDIENCGLGLLDTLMEEVTSPVA